MSNIVAFWTYPVVMIQYLQSHPLAGTYLMISTIAQSMKLISFHHVMYDNRELLKRIQKLPKQNNKQLASTLNVNIASLEMALTYPKNLTWSHFQYFLCAPTLCYQLHYPTLDRMRKIFVAKRVLELVLGNFFMLYLIHQHMLPIAEASIVPLKNGDYKEVFI